MKKEEYIRKYGEAAYEKQQEQTRDWQSLNPMRLQAAGQRQNLKRNYKDGEDYEKAIVYQMNGLPHEKRLIRLVHAQRWRQFKQIIAPESQLHHEWIPETADYRGLALVEKDRHMHGFINVIQILEGEITLLTEAEIREGNGAMVKYIEIRSGI